jgi:twitching motility protein PilT
VDRGDLDRLLVLLDELDGSDLHIKAGAPPRMRIAGALRILDDEPAFTSEETLAIAESMMAPAILETFRTHHEADFAYSVSGTGRFRVNAFYQRSSVALAMRRVRANASTVTELGLPEVVNRISE